MSTKFGMRIHFHMLIKNISVLKRSDNKCQLNPLFRNFQDMSAKIGMWIYVNMLMKNISFSIRSDNKCPLKSVILQFSRHINEFWYVDTSPYADQEYISFK